MAKEEKKSIPFIVQLIILVVVMLFVRTYILGTIYVKGVSMEPGFHHGDFVFISKMITHIGEYEQGDIVICEIEEARGMERIIKRVIGVAGDEIDIFRDGDEGSFYVHVNGERLDEPYIKDMIGSRGTIEYPYVVPEGCYFVMGDNRNSSMDSRDSSIGAIKQKDIMGKVFFRLYPFHDISMIP